MDDVMPHYVPSRRQQIVLYVFIAVYYIFVYCIRRRDAAAIVRQQYVIYLTFSVFE